MQPLREKDDAMNITSAIPLRTDVKVEDTWDLTATYPTPAEWQADFAKLQEEFPKISQWKGRVGESAATLRDVLECEKQLDLLLENLRVYAHLKCAEDASNAESLARQSEIVGLYT